MTKFLMLSIILLFQENAEVKSSSSQDKGIYPPPQVVKNVSVIYPQETISNRIDGKVYLQVLVDTLGYVAYVRIDSSDHDVLSQLAIHRVRGIRFTQSYIDGTHVTSWLPMIVIFDATSDSTKSTNYTIKIKRPAGESVVLDKNPALIKIAFPIYPQEALNNNLEGRVVVEVLIDKNGNAKEAFAVETDNVIFNESALEVVGRFHFTPGMLNGQPVPAWVGIPIPYTMPNKKQ
jgi:TonB family protein